MHADPFAPAALNPIPRSAPVGGGGDPSPPQPPLDDFAELAPSNVVARCDPEALPVLACDLGTHFGWALRTSACITSGTLNLTERARETRGDRLLRLWRWLHNVQRAQPLSLVAYELVQHMGDKQRLAAHCYAQFQAVLLMFAARNEIPVVDVHTGTLKKAITGRGSHPKGTGKDAMQAAVMALGYTPDSYDEADAIGVLHWAINIRGRA